MSLAAIVCTFVAATGLCLAGTASTADQPTRTDPRRRVRDDGSQGRLELRRPLYVNIGDCSTPGHRFGTCSEFPTTAVPRYRESAQRRRQLCRAVLLQRQDQYPPIDLRSPTSSYATPFEMMILVPVGVQPTPGHKRCVTPVRL